MFSSFLKIMGNDIFYYKKSIISFSEKGNSFLCKVQKKPAVLRHYRFTRWLRPKTLLYLTLREGQQLVSDCNRTSKVNYVTVKVSKIDFRRSFECETL